MSLLIRFARVLSLLAAAATILLWVWSYRALCVADYSWIKGGESPESVQHYYGASGYIESGCIFVGTYDEYVDDSSVRLVDTKLDPERYPHFHVYSGAETVMHAMAASAWAGRLHGFLGFGEYREDLTRPFDANAPRTIEEAERIQPLVLAGRWPTKMTTLHNVVSDYRVPFWFVAMVFSLPALTFPIGGWRRRRKRCRLGLCIKCGYDLRGTAGACPECGAERAAISAATRTSPPPTPRL